MHQKYRICGSNSAGKIPWSNVILIQWYAHKGMRLLGFYFGADLYYHLVCLSGYVNKYSRETKKNKRNKETKTKEKKRHLKSIWTFTKNVFDSGTVTIPLKCIWFRYCYLA